MTNEQKQDADAFFADQFEKSDPPVRSKDLLARFEKLLTNYGNASFDCGAASDEMSLDRYSRMESWCSKARSELTALVKPHLANAERSGAERSLP